MTHKLQNSVFVGVTCVVYFIILGGINNVRVSGVLLKTAPSDQGTVTIVVDDPLDYCHCVSLQLSDYSYNKTNKMH